MGRWHPSFPAHQNGWRPRLGWHAAALGLGWFALQAGEGVRCRRRRCCRRRRWGWRAAQGDRGCAGTGLLNYWPFRGRPPRCLLCRLGPAPSPTAAGALCDKPGSGESRASAISNAMHVSPRPFLPLQARVASVCSAQVVLALCVINTLLQLSQGFPGRATSLSITAVDWCCQWTGRGARPSGELGVASASLVRRRRPCLRPLASPRLWLWPPACLPARFWQTPWCRTAAKNTGAGHRAAADAPSPTAAPLHCPAQQDGDAGGVVSSGSGGSERC